MDLTTIPFLLLLFQVWITKSLVIQSTGTAKPKRLLSKHNITEIMKTALIRKKILFHLGKSDTHRKSLPVQVKRPETESRKTEYIETDINSYHSEPPDNFSNENIIQFNLFNRINGKPIEVENVHLLVRVKLKKPRTNKKSTRDMNTKRRKKQRRRKKFKEVDIIVSNVTTNGAPDTIIASEKTQIRKTKSLRLSIPKDVIQNVLDSKKYTLQFFIQCLGCDKKAKMILVHKKRRKRKSAKSRNRNSQGKLHKRRPMLFIYSHYKNGS